MEDSFERAFRDRVAGCRGACDCGREFWDAYNSGYSWEEGEVAALEADPNATGLNYAVECLEFEGRRFVIDCSCWKARGAKIAAWLDAHADAVAEYLTLEKKRKEAEAARSPVVS